MGCKRIDGSSAMEKLANYLLVLHLCAFPLLGSSNATADDAAPTQAGITAQVEALEKSLGLSAAQTAKAQPLILDNIQQREAVMANFGLGKNDGAFNKLSLNQKRQLSKQTSAINSATDKELAAILSSDQLKQYQSIREANKKKAVEKMKGES
jgi:hypothetical protein